LEIWVQEKEPGQVRLKFAVLKHRSGPDPVRSEALVETGEREREREKEGDEAAISSLLASHAVEHNHQVN
jgi:hypothetical protein